MVPNCMTEFTTGGDLQGEPKARRAMGLERSFVLLIGVLGLPTKYQNGVNDLHVHDHVSQP